MTYLILKICNYFFLSNSVSWLLDQMNLFRQYRCYKILVIKKFESLRGNEATRISYSLLAMRRKRLHRTATLTTIRRRSEYNWTLDPLLV